MPRVYLVHWREEEIADRAERLEAAGCEVDHDISDYKSLRKSLKSDPPDAVVIDLSRLPSHGREIGTWLRSTKATRSIPLVFVGGEPAKVDRAKQQLPDAVYCPWSRIRSSLKKAIANPPKNSVSPGTLSGYSGTPLPDKLGIKPGFVVAVINGPEDFAETLGELPEGAKLRFSARGKNDLMIWFPRKLADFENRVLQVAARFGAGGLWIAWPKKASGVKSDLSGALVRKIGLESGLVDFKVCSIDATYSGHKFARRKT